MSCVMNCNAKLYDELVECVWNYKNKGCCLTDWDEAICISRFS